MKDKRTRRINKECSPQLLDTLAVNTKRLRLAKGLSQEEFAEKSGFHRTTISLVERRKRNVTLGVVEALANGLGVDVPSLLSQSD